ncbi:MAG: class I SAM-dependent methyltransferase, partial [Cyanobacteria bacterium P01_A01_bin.40]
EQIKYAPRHWNIEYSVQAAEKTNFTERQFDLITVAQAIHWFDLEQFWSEVKRVLKPGGIFAAWGYGWAIISPEIDLLVNRLILERIKSHWLPGNKLIINQYRELDFPLTAIATPQDFCIEQMWTREQFFNYMSTWSAMKKHLAQAGASSIIEAKNEIAKIWSDRETKKVRMAIYLKVGIYD